MQRLVFFSGIFYMTEYLVENPWLVYYVYFTHNVRNRVCHPRSVCRRCIRSFSVLLKPDTRNTPSVLFHSERIKT